MKNRTKSIVTIVYLLILSVGFVLLYSTATSPLYPTFYGDDAAQFQTIGMCWSKGLLPYVGAFDHKGPFIFWVNMLGYMSSYVLIQSLFLFASLLGAYKITKLYSNKLVWHLFSGFLVIYYMYYIYEGGDMTEEYCLPFLMWSLYYIVKYLKGEGKKKEEHPVGSALLYGICLGISILTRMTNFIMVAAGVITIVVILISNRKFRNLFWNAMTFILGAVATILPFAVYFAINNAFVEFWDGTVLANINYVNVNVPWIFEIDSILVIRNWILAYLCVVVLLITIFCSKVDGGVRLFSIIAFIIEIVFFCSGKFYYHYAIICIPQLVMVTGETISLIGSKTIMPSIALGVALLFYSYVNMVAFFRWPYDRYVEYNHEDVMDYDALMDRVDGTFVAYGDYYTKPLYIRCNILPHYRYFTVQDWHSRISSELKADMYRTFKYGDVEYILTQDDRCELIKDVLVTDYHCLETNGNFSLYKRN